MKLASIKTTVLAGIVVALGLTSTEAAEVVDGVAAIVNERLITYSDVRDAVSPLAQSLYAEHTGQELVTKLRAAQRDALNQLIERSLILDEFKVRGASLPDSVVDGLINERISADFGGDRTAFIKTLQAERMSLAQFRERERDRFIVRAMLYQKSGGDAVVSPYKIEKYYQEHPDQYQVPEQIKLRMIVIRKKPVTATTTNLISSSLSLTNATESGLETNNAPVADAGRVLAEELLRKLDNGDVFDNLAKTYSEDSTANRGGAWGWIGRTDLGKEISDVAFSLKAGEHSRVIETDKGYYLLQVDEAKPAHLKPLTAVRDEIEKILLQELRTKKQKQWVEALRAKAYVRLF